jgi:hypothetical protein
MDLELTEELSRSMIYESENLSPLLFEEVFPDLDFWMIGSPIRS